MGPMNAPTSLVLAPTADPHVFVSPDGSRVTPPAGWVCVPPGDAMLTRRVKQAGPSWAVVEKRGRKAFSRGLWAPAENVAAVRASVEVDRASESYGKKRTADAARRKKGEEAYAEAFEGEVRAYLRFSAEWDVLGRAMAKLVAAHATPVGSGTVARTKRISVEARAEAAVIAWMRHQTTAYDEMAIARIKGERREVRRALARQSVALLARHRVDVPHEIEGCALCASVVARAARG